MKEWNYFSMLRTVHRLTTVGGSSSSSQRSNQSGRSYPDYDYYKPPEIPLPTAEKEAVDALTGGYRRSDINALQAARRIYMAKNEADKTPCFVFIMKTLSEESIEGMGKLENYDQEIKDSRNPALLLDGHRTSPQH